MSGSSSKFKPASEMLGSSSSLTSGSSGMRSLPKSTVGSLASSSSGRGGSSGGSGSSSSSGAGSSSSILSSGRGGGSSSSAKVVGAGTGTQRGEEIKREQQENDEHDNDDEEEDEEPTYDESSETHLNNSLDLLQEAPDLGDVSTARILELLSIASSIIKDNPGECICKYPLHTRELMQAYMSLAFASKHGEFNVIKCQGPAGGEDTAGGAGSASDKKSES